jgi:hypothetical protein
LHLKKSKKPEEFRFNREATDGPGMETLSERIIPYCMEALTFPGIYEEGDLLLIECIGASIPIILGDV